MSYDPIPDEDETICTQVIGAAIEVHRHLGPGFLESIYRQALAWELAQQGFRVEEEKIIVVAYKQLQIAGQRLDLLINGRVVVEIKCVDAFHPIHRAQVLSYLKTTNLRLGLLLNFHEEVLKDGIKRVVR
jgi:GxxExxY protein